MGKNEEPEPAPCEIYYFRPNMHRRTHILQHPKKLLKPTHDSLLDPLPPEICADIDIWLSDLEHRNKFKHIISRFKYMSNPALFEIRHE